MKILYKSFFKKFAVFLQSFFVILKGYQKLALIKNLTLPNARFFS
jgi:hypothetical protein